MDRKTYDEKDKQLIIDLIESNRNTFVNGIEESDKLLWKDFLLYFKRAFSYEVGDMYTPKISLILKELLNIDQEVHVRKGIELTFVEWMNLKN